MATPEHLTETLAESALDFGARALKDYLSGDSRVLLMHAGICVEHAAKACSANLSPVLLADIHNGSFDSLLMLSGLGSQACVGRLRTIGCREATSRVARLRPAQVGGDTLELLIGIRDGIVHVGYAEESDARDLLAASLRYVSELLKDLVGRDPLWGSHAELVESLIFRITHQDPTGRDSEDRDGQAVRCRPGQSRTSRGASDGSICTPEQ